MCEHCNCGQEESDFGHIQIPVKGMCCEGCSGRLNETLNSLPGVRAKADHTTGMVDLELQNPVFLPMVKKVIREMGFEL